MRRAAETLFFGSYVNKIDAKGRLATPALFRRALDLERVNAIFCIPSTEEGEKCLDCGGADYIETLIESISMLSRFSKDRRCLERKLTAHTSPISLDKEGRIVLPQHLREYANLTNEAMFTGLGESFQIWNPGAFQKIVAAEEEIAEQAKLSLCNPTDSEALL